MLWLVSRLIRISSGLELSGKIESHQRLKLNDTHPQGMSMAWGALDDVVRGGRSESGFEVRAGVGEDGGRGGMFSGLVRVGHELEIIPHSYYVYPAEAREFRSVNELACSRVRGSCPGFSIRVGGFSSGFTMTERFTSYCKPDSRV